MAEHSKSYWLQTSLNAFRVQCTERRGRITLCLLFKMCPVVLDFVTTICLQYADFIVIQNLELQSLNLSCYICQQGESVAKLGYFSEWYNASKQTKTSLKIIFQRVQTRTQIIAFKSPNFDVSRETFLTVCTSIFCDHSLKKPDCA